MFSGTLGPKGSPMGYFGKFLKHFFNWNIVDLCVLVTW